LKVPLGLKRSMKSGLCFLRREKDH
jgi:hypothetical protein